MTNSSKPKPKRSESTSKTGLKPVKTRKNSSKSSMITSKKRLYGVKSQKKSLTSRDSIYSLDTWKLNMELTPRPRNKVVVSFNKRLKHAWQIVKGK